MPTLASRKYYITGAPIPPEDLDILLDSSEYLVGLTIATYHDLGYNFSISAQATNLGGAETFITVNKTLGHQYKVDNVVEITAQLDAVVVTFSGSRSNWPATTWPSTSWVDFSYIVGDFYHELVP